MKFSEYIYININRSVVIHFLANNLGLDTISSMSTYKATDIRSMFVWIRTSLLPLLGHVYVADY